MIVNAFTILVVLALIFSALSIPWGHNLLAVAVILLSVALLIK